MPVAQVQRVVQQSLVVGADIQGHRDDPARVDARRGSVDGQLADRDLDAPHAPVTDAEDLLGIAAHDQVDVVRPELQRGERVLDVVRLVDRQEDAPGAPVFVGVPLDRVADRRVVDNWQQLRQMLGQHPVVQGLVAVVQLFQVDILGQVTGLPLQLLVDAQRLLLQRQHRRRQPPGQPEGRPLGAAEGRSAIADRILQNARYRRRPCGGAHVFSYRVFPPLAGRRRLSPPAGRVLRGAITRRRRFGWLAAREPQTR